jgi:predicted RNase H-like HicB family nuclease
MQYHAFVHNPIDRIFMASVVGLPNLTANGITEKEAIDRLKISSMLSLRMVNWSRSILMYPAIDHQKKVTTGLPIWGFSKTIQLLMTF